MGVPELVSDKQLAIVGNVLPDSAADAGGLKSGDQIIKIDDNNIIYFSELQKIIRSRPDLRISMDVLRNGKNIRLNVIIGSKNLKNSV